MSVELFKTDNISVIGEYVERGSVPMDKQSNTIIDKYLHLFFTIHVNGKIKTFSHYIKLIEYTDRQPEDGHHNLTLHNWEGWYMLYSTLKELGYYIGEDKEILPQNTNIDKWIDKTYEIFKNKDTFNY